MAWHSTEGHVYIHILSVRVYTRIQGDSETRTLEGVKDKGKHVARNCDCLES